VTREEFLRRLASRPAPSQEPLPGPPLREPPRLERFETFTRRFADSGATVKRVALASAPAEVLRLAAARSATRFAAWTTERVDSLAQALDASLTRVTVPSEPEAIRAALDPVDIGIVEAEFAIAESGTVGVCSGPGRPRLVSCLPRTLIILLDEKKLLPRLEDVPDWLREHGGLPSALALISGVSCTGDIGESLIVGVHGPDEVHVLAHS
jgi:L-lactate dehydrogenase complex protein LldG